jgi:hypothetical protein
MCAWMIICSSRTHVCVCMPWVLESWISEFLLFPCELSALCLLKFLSWTGCWISVDHQLYQNACCRCFTLTLVLHLYRLLLLLLLLLCTFLHPNIHFTCKVGGGSLVVSLFSPFSCTSIWTYIHAHAMMHQYLLLARLPSSLLEYFGEFECLSSGERNFWHFYVMKSRWVWMSSSLEFFSLITFRELTPWIDFWSPQSVSFGRRYLTKSGFLALHPISVLLNEDET